MKKTPQLIALGYIALLLFSEKDTHFSNWHRSNQ